MQSRDDAPAQIGEPRDFRRRQRHRRQRLKIFRFLLDFWESWRLLRVRFGVGI